MTTPVTVQTTPLVVSVTDDNVSVTVSGGVGPQGEQGASGVSAISQATDVAFTTPTDGDVLRYSNGKWRNYQDTGLVDGGNF